MEAFDPYHKWLGIPSNERPINYYRLLGLQHFESDLDVIEGAADRQMAFVRQYQSGDHAAVAARVLNELATVRLCLLKPDTKAAYDAQLRQQLAPLAPAEPTIADLPFIVDDSATESGPLKRRQAAAGFKNSGNARLGMIGGGFAVIVVVLLGVFSRGGRSKPPVVNSVKPDQVAVSSPDRSVTIETSETKSTLRVETTTMAPPAPPTVSPVQPVPANRHDWPADAPPPAVAPFDAQQARGHQAAWAAFLKVPVEFTNSIGMKFRLIPPGQFVMGTTKVEADLAAGGEGWWPTLIRSQAPQHTVILTQPTYLGVYDVTQAQYEKIMGTNPSHFSPIGGGKDAVAGMDTANHPVENVSWLDAAEFCTKLSQREQLEPFYGRATETTEATGYRLPTNAEWECACRAGTTTPYWFGDKDEDPPQSGWSIGGPTHPVGKLRANPFGFFDVHGNVWQWVQDGWDAGYYGQFQEASAVNPTGPSPPGFRAFRGAGSAFRGADAPTRRVHDIGFRVSLTHHAVRLRTPERAATPSTALQESKRKLVEEVIELSKATTMPKQQQAVAVLLKIADDPATPSDELYVVLQTALQLIRETGDITAFRQAVRKLTGAFEVDATAEEAKQLVEFIAACKSAGTLDPAIADLVGLVDSARKANQFRDARRWLDSADNAAERLKAKSALLAIGTSRTLLTERQQAFDAYQNSLMVLKTTSDDPGANYQVGFWNAVFEENWNEALPRLAKGSDPKWQFAAKTELVDEGTASRLKAVEAWWEVAQIATGTAKSSVQRQMLNLLVKLGPQLTNPLDKVAVSKRKTELEKLLKITPAGAIAVWEPDKQIPEGGELPVGEWIDLLATVKLPDHVVLGNWKRLNGGIVCEPFSRARLIVPVTVIGGYELTCKFTRRTNKESVYFSFPVGETSCYGFIDGYGGTIAGLETIDRKAAINRLGTPSAVRQKRPFANGVAHEFHVSVSSRGKDARIQLTMDGDQLISWSGKTSQLQTGQHDALPNPHLIGVHTIDCVADIHDLKLKLHGGGRGYRLADDWKNPLFPVADTPTPDVAKKCLDWNGKKYFISDKPVPITEAQLLATQMKGRLLTISSAAEEQMIVEQSRGISLWMAGWCPVDRKWRDERNRPLRYFGKWAFLVGRVQPDNFNGNQTQLNIGTYGWDDVDTGSGGFHACIEWGEEYP